MTYSMLGGVGGFILGAAVGGYPGSALGAIFVALVGITISLYINRKMILDRPFLIPEEIDTLIGTIDNRNLYFLPASTKTRIMSLMRSLLERLL